MATRTIRLASETDAEQIAAIYGPIVLNAAISFEIEPPGAEEMRCRISDTLQRYPWLVCEHGGEILGYAYASQYRTRAAYQWSVDTAVYTGAWSRRMGVGRALYTALLGVLPLQGFYNAYAGIALPNAGSVGLHEAMRFDRIGIYRHAGFKLGRWHDVGWWQRSLQPHRQPESGPVALAVVSASEAYRAILAR